MYLAEWGVSTELLFEPAKGNGWQHGTATVHPRQG